MLYFTNLKRIHKIEWGKTIITKYCNLMSTYVIYCNLMSITTV